MATVIALMLGVLTFAIGGILYYWCFYTYDTTFEDYRIDEATDQDMLNHGIKNEWVLGVSAHSIDLVEAVHGDAVAEHILEQAESQVEAAKTYREQIDGKYMLYRIEVDTSGGERIYRYSVIKDIYLEHFPGMVTSMACIAVGVFLITLLIVRRVTHRMSETIGQTSRSIKRMARGDSIEEMDTSTIEDRDLAELVDSYQLTRRQLDEQREVQQRTLQYISHEIRTPVMIIKTYADSARSRIYPRGDLDSSLVIIENQTDRIQSAVSELLLVTKVEAEYTNEEPTVIDLSELVSKQVGAFSRINPSVEVELSLPGKIEVAGFASQLSMLVENLVADQFGHCAGSVSIRVSRKGDIANMGFGNDGDPLSAQEREHVFDPFVKDPGGGSSLGLSLCKRIVTLHGGSIRVRQDGDLNGFEVELPVAYMG
ncbi:MAG: HAMP domain-containing histidine kinase [Atopobiaceae bacterium]|jgi:two-component system sensor histidine kinase CssS|nr:HAMP domain-containing histidine kinase [Atopobiaceae bacterium]MCI2207010.1 HAMP domain-containing histidine kinase [Atopobiaceae bacterium]